MSNINLCVYLTKQWKGKKNRPLKNRSGAKH